MTKDKEKKPRNKTWSVAHLKHPKSEYTFRVGEYSKNGVLQVFHMEDKKLKAKSLKFRLRGQRTSVSNLGTLRCPFASVEPEACQRK